MKEYLLVAKVDSLVLVCFTCRYTRGKKNLIVAQGARNAPRVLSPFFVYQPETLYEINKDSPQRRLARALIENFIYSTSTPLNFPHRRGIFPRAETQVGNARRRSRIANEITL